MGILALKFSPAAHTAKKKKKWNVTYEGTGGCYVPPEVTPQEVYILPYTVLLLRMHNQV